MELFDFEGIGMRRIEIVRTGVSALPSRLCLKPLTPMILCLAVIATVSAVGSGSAFGAPANTPVGTFAPAIAINVGKGAGAPGQTTSVDIMLETIGAEVVSTQNRIDFLPPIQIPSRPNGDPDCRFIRRIDKEDSTFRFMPLGCVPGATCTAVQASIRNSEPIPTGPLYSCNVEISQGAAPGTYPLSNVWLAASNGQGALLSVTGADGAIAVHATPVSVDVDDTHASPGADAAVSVRLTPGEAEVVAIENSIAFAPPLRIAARSDGTPDCTVNPAIDKDNADFTFLPPRCLGDGCTAVIALVLSFSNLTPIPDGAALYTCRVLVDADAAPGTYVLRNSEQRGSTPDAVDLPAVGRTEW